MLHPPPGAEGQGRITRSAEGGDRALQGLRAGAAAGGPGAGAAARGLPLLPGPGPRLPPLLAARHLAGPLRRARRRLCWGLLRQPHALLGQRGADGRGQGAQDGAGADVVQGKFYQICML